MVASVNNSIFAKSEIKRQGAMNENYKAYIEPANKRSEKLKNDYLEKMVDYSSKNEFVHNLIYSTSELSGMYGFLGETLIPRSKGYQMEKANMGSFSNRFWDASVGGLGGDAMEIARRFFPHEDHNITQINPIKNTMPDWIPEKFRTGDPYAKVPLGDARLPGKGYESLNKLHSDKYGRYGAFDRYKILSDIAPLSEQYKIWRKIAKTEVKDPYLLKQMEEIDKRVEEQTKEHDFYNYRFIGNYPCKKLQGYDNLPKSGKICVITKSQKDVMALYAYGIPACAPNSETIIPSEFIINDLTSRFEHVFALWDNDRTGVTFLNKIKKKYPQIKCLIIPRNLEAKDFSDLRAKYGYKKTKEFIVQYLQSIKQ